MFINTSIEHGKNAVPQRTWFIPEPQLQSATGEDVWPSITTYDCQLFPEIILHLSKLSKLIWISKKWFSAEYFPKVR